MSVSKQELIGSINKYILLRKIVVEGRLKKDTFLQSQFPILNCISENDNITQKELADMLKVTPASIALSTKRLEQTGFLEKIQDKDNKRCNKIRLTKKGKKMLEGSRNIFKNVDDITFRNFKKDEVELLRNFLDRMIYNISGDTNENIDKYEIFSLKEKLKKNSEM